MGRDPGRIYPFCIKLAELWQSNFPDLRFAQIVEKLSSLENDIFYLEDDQIIRVIEGTFKNHI